jgi:hypothetical protein
VGEALDVCLGQLLRRHRHQAVEVRRRLGLVGAEQLHQILEVLACEARHHVLAAQVRPVTRGAASRSWWSAALLKRAR